MSSYRGPERRSARSRLMRRVGNRGLALAIIGIIWTARGYSVAIGDETRLDPWRTGVVHFLAPPETRAVVWIACGFCALLGAAVLAPRYQRLGFSAAVVPPALQVVSYLVGWAVWVAPGAWLPADVVGYGIGWITAGIWLLVYSLIRIIAGWPEDYSVAVSHRRGQR